MMLGAVDWSKIAYVLVAQLCLDSATPWTTAL